MIITAWHIYSVSTLYPRFEHLNIEKVKTLKKTKMTSHPFCFKVKDFESNKENFL